MRARPSADSRFDDDGVAPGTTNHPNRIQLGMQLDGPGACSKDPELCPLVSVPGKATKAAAPRLSWQNVLRPGGRLSPDLLAIAMVYFVQGILKLAGLALTFYQKDDLKLEPAQMSLVDTLAMVPWTIKPLYGLVSDNFPLWGMRRRPYLVAAGLAGCLGWAGLAVLPPALGPAVALYCLCRASTAFADVVADSLVVEKTRDAPPGTDGALQSLCWGCHATGRVITSYLSGWLLAKIGSRGVFAATATFPLLICLASALIKEQPINSSAGAHALASPTAAAAEGLGSSPSKKLKHSHPSGPAMAHSSSSSSGSRGCLQRLRLSSLAVWVGLLSLWAALKNPLIFKPALFLFVWQGTPSTGTAMFYFKTVKLGFDPEFLGRSHLVAALADLAGILLYNTCLRKVGLRRLLLWGTLAGAAVALTPLILVTRTNLALGISDRTFALADTALINSIGQVCMMPTLVLSARICPEGVEATLYASLMSLLNAGTATADLLGAALTHAFGVTKSNFDRLAPLLVLCVSLGLLPLLFIAWVPSQVSGPPAAVGRGADGKHGRRFDEDEEEGVHLLWGRHQADSGAAHPAFGGKQVELMQVLPAPALHAVLVATAADGSPRHRMAVGPSKAALLHIA